MLKASPGSPKTVSTPDSQKKLNKQVGGTPAGSDSEPLQGYTAKLQAALGPARICSTAVQIDVGAPDEPSIIGPRRLDWPILEKPKIRMPSARSCSNAPAERRVRGAHGR